MSRVPGLSKALLHQPCQGDDPFFAKTSESPAEYVLQLFFTDLFSLEAACARQGELAALMDSLDSLLGTAESRSQQAMAVRSFAPGGQGHGLPQGAPATACTYLVAYYGEEQPHDLWLSEYMEKHVPLMQRMPGVREVEVYTQLDWLGGLALPRARAIQRNKVVFDSPAGLEAAQQSPIRAEMRADFLSLPQIGLASTHDPMRTDCVFNAGLPRSAR